MDNKTLDQRRRNMQAIKSSHTVIEELLAKELWRRGYRYRRNNKKIFGKPDFTFTKYKVAIFADSEFFHGKDWETAKHKIKTNKEFWHKKIESNIRRDDEVNQYLTNQGWKVLRFWGCDIKNNLQFCVNDIIEVINSQKANGTT
ncbi:very short patch repair endonuclease [Carboxylicivirga sp. RSCT41]|uniref:very short patch repair endonuclease n=1 Tax=Carboxylicivirga agarovorans TaxID=3417570 RepID=UPI003D341C4A